MPRGTVAQLAASRHDWRGLYSIVRSLGGASPSSVPRPVRQQNGELTTNETERQQRWQEHFKDVFRGRSVTMDELRAQPHETPIWDSHALTGQDTVNAWTRLGRNKGGRPRRDLR